MLSEGGGVDYVAGIRSEYDAARAKHARSGRTAKRQTLAGARANKAPIDWSDYAPPKPSFLGTKVFEHYELEELVRYIDWTPFFRTWELSGKYPNILDDEVVGETENGRASCRERVCQYV